MKVPDEKLMLKFVIRLSYFSIFLPAKNHYCSSKSIRSTFAKTPPALSFWTLAASAALAGNHSLVSPFLPSEPPAIFFHLRPMPYKISSSFNTSALSSKPNPTYLFVVGARDFHTQ